jgi:tight adherence protein B
VNPTLVGLSVAVALAVVAAFSGVIQVLRAGSARRTRQRLQEISIEKVRIQDDAQRIARDTQLTSLPAPIDALLRRQPLILRLQNLLAGGDMSISVGKFLALMAFLAFMGGVIAAHVAHWAPAALIGAPALASIPVSVAVRKKRRRVAAFEKNFADSLDILTAALRAGLAFSAAVQVVAEESPEPVSKEFGLMFEENRLGLDMKLALRNLAQRVDCAELRMFVTAVILQRETGGNLAEILDGTAAVIRDRFRILGEVRALTAQQRFSGLILSILPIVMAGLLMVTAPDYMRVLIDDPWGPYLIGGALTLQLIGYIAIKRIVAIKV